MADATMDTAFASCPIVATSDSRRCGLGSTAVVERARAKAKKATCSARQVLPSVKSFAEALMVGGRSLHYSYRSSTVSLGSKSSTNCIVLMWRSMACTWPSEQIGNYIWYVYCLFSRTSVREVLVQVPRFGILLTRMY